MLSRCGQIPNLFHQANEYSKMRKGMAACVLDRYSKTGEVRRRDAGDAVLAKLCRCNGIAAEIFMPVCADSPCRCLTYRIKSCDLGCGSARIVNLDYSEARRHMKLWVHWPQIARMLADRDDACRRRNLPFVVPGYRKCLELAGIVGRPEPAYERPPPPVEPDPLPSDIATLTQMVEALEQKNRLERAVNARLLVELDLAKDEIRELSVR